LHCARIAQYRYYQLLYLFRQDVDDYIEFYNHRRFHETLAYKKPMKVYKESILDNNALNIAA
jgi:putative transposase